MGVRQVDNQLPPQMQPQMTQPQMTQPQVTQPQMTQPQMTQQQTQVPQSSPGNQQRPFVNDQTGTFLQNPTNPQFTGSVQGQIPLPNVQLPGTGTYPLPDQTAFPQYPDTGRLSPPVYPNNFNPNDPLRWNNDPNIGPTGSLNPENWNPSNQRYNAPTNTAIQQPNYNQNPNGIPTGLNLNSPEAQLGYSYIMAMISGMLNDPHSAEGLLQLVTFLRNFLNNPRAVPLIQAFDHRVQELLNNPTMYNDFINHSPQPNAIIQTNERGGILSALLGKGKDLMTVLKGIEVAKGKALENILRMATGTFDTGIGIIDGFAAPIYNVISPSSASSSPPTFRTSNSLFPFLNFGSSSNNG